jgi:uncharacterized membrane protein YfcA
MPDPGVVVPTLAILFVAALAHAVFGFGTALVAMPLLVLVLGLELATPLVALAMLVSVGVILRRDWRAIEMRAVWRLLLGSALGIPAGLLLLESAPPAAVRGILGAILIAYSLFNLLRPELPKLEREWPVYVFGFVAGLLGGAYNTNGPPLVLYGALRRWPPERFRATLQSYFLPAALLICSSHAASGLWSERVFVLFVLALPGLVLANLLGPALARRIPLAAFTRVLYAVLALLGALMFV